MKKIIFLSISLLLPPFCFVIRAQQLPTILTTQEYKTGIYKDFSEFLKNEPSVTEKFVIVTLSGERKNEKGEDDSS